MFDFMDYYFWNTIALFKQFYDAGKADFLLQQYGNCAIDGDYIYEMSSECMTQVFADTSNYYHEDKEAEVFVFCDQALDSFYMMCRQYEAIRRIHPESNPHRKAMESQIWYSLTFDSYSYETYLYSDQDQKGRCRIVLVLYSEFYDYFEVPGSLLEIKEELETHMRIMKQEIANPMETVCEEAA